MLYMRWVLSQKATNNKRAEGKQMANVKLCECGGKAEFVKTGKHCGFVSCTKCGDSTKIYASKQNAIKAWNGIWRPSYFMACPVCGEKAEVIDSRSDGESVTRKRKCLGCSYRFHTVEIDEDLYRKISKEN